jgi:DnaK suppressor protein
MTPEFITQRKEDLLKKKEGLEKELSVFAQKVSKDNWETKYPKMNSEDEDRADEVEEYENLLPIERSLEEKLKEVNIALEKIEKGTYGKCDNCGEEGCECDISEERLKVLPEAKTCNSCKCKDSECFND